MARKWLIELRKSKKISQRQAAELAKMKHSQYASLECGEGSLIIDSELAQRLAKIFGVDAEYIEEWERVTPITSRARSKLNPNKPTILTRKIICWYTDDGETPAEIGKQLCRTTKQIKKILDDCRKTGEYTRYNAMRRSYHETLSFR